MRTGRSLTVCRSLLLGRGGGLDLIPLNFPLGCGPESDAPQFHPWVWAWIWSPSISPLGVGLDLIPLNFPLGCGPEPDPPQFPPWVWAWTWSPSISPLGVGLNPIPLNFPLGCGPGGGFSFPGGCLLLGGGSPSPDGSPWQGGASFLGGWQYPSKHWGRPLPPWTESQTRVKTYNLGHNFVAAGNRNTMYLQSYEINWNGVGKGCVPCVPQRSLVQQDP